AGASGSRRGHRRPCGRTRAPPALRRAVRRPPGGQTFARGGARPRARAHGEPRRARRPPHLHGDASPARNPDTARSRPRLLGGTALKITVGHLYPSYLNIYADRGNIAVLSRRAALRGHELTVTEITVGDDLTAGSFHPAYI